MFLTFDFIFLKHLKREFYSLFLTAFIMTTPLVLIGYFANHAYSYVWFIAAGLVFTTVILNTVPVLNPQNKVFMENLPKRITIENGKLIKEGNSEKSYVVREIQHVKKITDEGDWYQRIFYFPHKVGDCICQKDLITQGSIEEFENIFEGLIVKKNQN